MAHYYFSYHFSSPIQTGGYAGRVIEIVEEIVAQDIPYITELLQDLTWGKHQQFKDNNIRADQITVVIISWQEVEWNDHPRRKVIVDSTTGR